VAWKLFPVDCLFFLFSATILGKDLSIDLPAASRVTVILHSASTMKEFVNLVSNKNKIKMH
jgi:hypothetical protein